MFAEKHVHEWWERCTEGQRSHLKASAASGSRVDADTLKLLVETRIPYGPVGTRWESDPEYAWSWPNEIREFVLSQ